MLDAIEHAGLPRPAALPRPGWRTAQRTLPGGRCLWLVLQHVLPKRLRRARNFGFLHPNSARAVRLLQVSRIAFEYTSHIEKQLNTAWQ